VNVVVHDTGDYCISYTDICEHDYDMVKWEGFRKNHSWHSHRETQGKLIVSPWIHPQSF
jgi:hypothetical protein